MIPRFSIYPILGVQLPRALGHLLSPHHTPPPCPHGHCQHNVGPQRCHARPNEREAKAADAAVAQDAAQRAALAVRQLAGEGGLK